MTDEPARDEQVARLRNALADLMGRNVELEQRIEALERERNELGVDEVARSLVRAARLAEAAMTDANPDAVGPGVRFVVPRLDVAMRGVVGRRGDGFGIRFPGPEEHAAAAALSTISMSVAHVPQPARAVDDRLGRFRAGLEAAQATLSAWGRDRGRTAAGEGADLATRLLGLRAQWGDAETVAGIHELAQALGRFGWQTETELEPATRDRYRAGSKALLALARRLAAAGGASPGDLAAIGSGLLDLADTFNARRE